MDNLGKKEAIGRNKYNLGNVVGLIRSEVPPKDKPYVIWGKILDSTKPLVVQLRIYNGTGDASLEANWNPIMVDGQSATINFSDIEGVPSIFTNFGIILDTEELAALDDKGEPFSKISIRDIFNTLKEFEPMKWYLGEQ